MPQLLHIDSSADLQNSRSRAVTRTFADAWRGISPQHTVIRRDLHRDPPPHLADPQLHWPSRLRTVQHDEQLPGEELQQALIAELVNADAVLIGAPMYNYSLPSTLKAWVDHIHVPGVTAPFDQPTQPLQGRPAVVVTARGGVYDPGTPTEGWDHAVPVLQLILGNALGMEVTVITTSLTLADTVPSLSDFRDRAGVELAAAHELAAATAKAVAEALAAGRSGV